MNIRMNSILCVGKRYKKADLGKNYFLYYNAHFTLQN